jgi:hypothetical protein
VLHYLRNAFFLPCELDILNNSHDKPRLFPQTALKLGLRNVDLLSFLLGRNYISKIVIGDTSCLNVLIKILVQFLKIAYHS